MIAGTLEIQLLANMARLQADMNQAKTMVSGTMRGISAAVDQAKGALAGLGLGLTAGGLVLLAKNAIDAADSMNDLSKSTGIAVEKLAGLRLAAKQSGGDLDGIATSINKLSVNIGKNSEKFTALGVTAKDPLEAFKQFADIFKDIEDPQLRAALGAEALGKSWASAAPLLSEGGKKIGEMVEKGEKLSGITKEITEASDAFNDKLVELGGTMNGILGQMLPLLNKVLDDFISLKGEGGGLGQVLGGALTEALRAVVILGGNVGFVLRGIGTELGGLAAQAAAVAVGDFSRAAEIGRMMTADAETARAKFDAWEKSILAVGAATGKTTTETKEMSAAEFDAATNAFLAKRATEEKARAFMNAANGAKKLAKAQKDLGLADAHVVLRAKLKAEIEASTAKALADGVESRRKYIDAIEAEIAAQQWQNDTLGMTSEQIALLVVARLEEKMAILQASGAMETEIAQLQEEIDLRKKLAGTVGTGERSRAAIEAQSAALRDQARIWDDLATGAGNFFSDLVMNGKSAFDNLKKWLKDLLAQMIALFAKRWVLNLAAGGTVGGSAASALASTGTDSLGGTLISSGASLAGNYLAGAAGFTGLGTWGTFAGAASGAIPAAAIGADAVAAGVGVNTFSASAGSYMSGIYTTLSAIPVWGWIAMAVIAIGAWIAGNHKGGPKTGGSWGGSFDAQGNPTGNPLVSGTDNGRFFTPNQMDPLFRELGTGIAKGYYETVKSLGGTAYASSFFAGGDMDPNGTSGARVSMQAIVNGRSVYNQRDIGIDQDTDQYRAELMLYGKRALLAAVQASDLPEGIAGILSTVIAETATSEQIDNIFALAKAFGDLKKMLTGFTVEEVLAEASKTYGDRLTDQRNALLDLAGSTTLTTASLATLSTATASYQQNVASLIVAFQQVKDSIGAMFEDTFRNITLAGLDKQGKYDFYQKDAEEARLLLATATDPEVIRMLTGRINQDINAAFGLLSPEEQAARGAEFIAQGKQAQKEANDRIEKLQKDAVDDMKKTLTKINDILDASAKDFKKAGSDIKEGGANILTASRGTTTVRVGGGGSGVITE